MSRAKLATSLAVLLVTGACASDAYGPDYDRYGRYVLSTINGDELPALISETWVSRLEFLGGSLRLNRDYSFTDSTDVRVTPLTGGSVRRTTDVAAGTFRFSRDTLYLDSTRGEHYHMVFQIAGSLTQQLAGSVLVYRK